MIGSDFELRVWETLLKLPLGKATTYSDIAARSAGRRQPARSARRSAEPDLLRRALPSRPRQGRRILRLPLGHHPQARHPRLGGRRHAGLTRGDLPTESSSLLKSTIWLTKAFEAEKKKKKNKRGQAL